MTAIVYGFDGNRGGHSSSHKTKEAARRAEREHKARPCSAVHRARARGLLTQGH